MTTNLQDTTPDAFLSMALANLYGRSGLWGILSLVEEIRSLREYVFGLHWAFRSLTGIFTETHVSALSLSQTYEFFDISGLEHEIATVERLGTKGSSRGSRRTEFQDEYI